MTNYYKIFDKFDVSQATRAIEVGFKNLVLGFLKPKNLKKSEF